MRLGRRAINAVRVTETVFVPNPSTVATVAALEESAGRGMAGRVGVIHRDNKNAPTRKFSGELGPLQRFPRGAPVRNILRTPNTALPAPKGPPAQPNPVMDTLSRMVW
jgi:hypothetical protein